MRACIQRGPILRRRCPRLQGVYNYRHISVSAIRQRPADSLSSASPFSSSSSSSSPSPPPFPSSLTPFAQRGTSQASSPPSSQILQNAHISTALHLTRGLLPRVLSPDSPELVFWDGLLRTASEEIRGIEDAVHGSSREKVHVVVYAADEFSGADALVGALLEHPFASDAATTLVRRRWEGHVTGRKLDIRYGDPSSRPGDTHVGTIYLSSPFLNSFPAQIHLTELRPPTSPSQADLQSLYTADVPIIVINPLTTPLASFFFHNPSAHSPIFPYPLPSHAIIVLTTPSPAALPPGLVETLASAFDSTSCDVSPVDRLLLVDPVRAHQALQALHSSPSNPSNIQRYQDDTVGSGLSAVMRALTSRLSSSTYAPASDLVAQTRIAKASALLDASLVTIRGALTHAESQLRLASQTVRILRGAVAEARARVEISVYGHGMERVGGNEAALSGHVANGSTSHANVVKEAMNGAEVLVKQVMDTLNWWRVLWRVDEVGWMVKQAVRCAWVGEVERAILPAYSTLPVAQAQLSTMAQSHLSALPAPLRSAVLTNTLAQLTAAPSYPVQTTTLLAPLTRRREVLDSGPTARLERAAQALVLRVGGSVAGGIGAGAGWVTWAGGASWIAGSGAAEMLEAAGTGAGVGLLLTLSGVRWAITRWEKARKSWWRDWKRVSDGVGRDVQATLKKSLDTQVLVVPLRACDGIEELASKRRDEVDRLKAEVEKVEDIQKNNR